MSGIVIGTRERRLCEPSYFRSGSKRPARLPQQRPTRGRLTTALRFVVALLFDRAIGSNSDVDATAFPAPQSGQSCAFEQQARFRSQCNHLCGGYVSPAESMIDRLSAEIWEGHSAEMPVIPCSSADLHSDRGAFTAAGSAGCATPEADRDLARR